MKNKYSSKIKKLLKQVHPRLFITHKLEFKNCFGAIAGYVNGHIFISCGRFGIALRLPLETLDKVFKEEGAKHLKYFPKGHIKKEYAVLPRKIMENRQQFKGLIDISVKYASLP